MAAVHSRRQFLSDVGKGVLVASLGPGHLVTAGAGEREDEGGGEGVDIHGDDAHIVLDAFFRRLGLGAPDRPGPPTASDSTHYECRQPPERIGLN